MKRILFSYFISASLIASLLLLFPSQLFALPGTQSGRSPYHATISSIKGFFSAKVGDTFFARVSTYEGSHNFRFTRVAVPQIPCATNGILSSRPCIPSGFKLFQGALQVGNRRQTLFDGVAADIVNDKLSIHFHGMRGERLYTAEYAVTERALIDPSPRIRLRQRRLSSQESRDPVFCSESEQLDGIHPFTARSSAFHGIQKRALGPLEMEIATDADAEFVKKNRGEARAFAKIQSQINAVEAMYMKDMNITLRVRFQNSYTKKKGQPYNKNGAPALLRQFRDVNEADLHLGPSDLRLLFSGKNFKGSVVGRAYQRVTCRVPFFSYAIIQRTAPIIQTIIIAHEIAHTLNASHDNSKPQRIMSARLKRKPIKKNKAEAQSFSDQSLLEMNDYLSENMECLTRDELSYATRPVVASASLDSNGRFALTVRELEGENCQIQILFYDSREGLISLPKLFAVTAENLQTDTLSLIAEDVFLNSGVISELTVLVKKVCNQRSDTLSILDSGKFTVQSTGSLNSVLDAANAILQNIERAS